MKRTPKKWWIKERHNPQLGVHFYAMGRMSKRDAKSNEESLYGTNIMHGFDTLEDYQAAIRKFDAR